MVTRLSILRHRLKLELVGPITSSVVARNTGHRYDSRDASTRVSSRERLGIARTLHVTWFGDVHKWALEVGERK